MSPASSLLFVDGLERQSIEREARRQDIYRKLREEIDNQKIEEAIRQACKDDLTTGYGMSIVVRENCFRSDSRED